MARLTPLQRAFYLGYRRGLAKARGELRVMAQNFDDAICEIRSEMQAAREEFHRYQALEEAIATERDLDILLH